MYNSRVLLRQIIVDFQFMFFLCKKEINAKQELKRQNELFFSENASVFVFIAEIIWQTFDVIIDNPYLKE